MPGRDQQLKAKADDEIMAFRPRLRPRLKFWLSDHFGIEDLTFPLDCSVGSSKVNAAVVPSSELRVADSLSRRYYSRSHNATVCAGCS